MKEVYEAAELEIVEFEAEDVIRTSGGSGDNETPGLPTEPELPDDIL